MASLYSTYYVRELQPDGLALATGRPHEPGLYSLPFPAVDCSSELLSVKPAKGSPAPGSWRLVAYVARSVKRPHAVRPGVYDAEGHGRRLASLRAFMRDLPDSAEEHVARAIVTHVAEYALGALALRPEHALPGDVEDALARICPRAEVRRIFSETRSSAYPSNSVGAGIDRQIAQERADRIAALEAEETKRVELAKPCTQTCDELGLVCVRVRHGDAVPALLSEAFRISEPHGAQDDEHLYIFVARSELLGAKVPATRHGAGEVLSGDHVPGLPAKSIAAVSDVGARHWLVFDARRKARPIVQGTHDYSTAEGRARIEQYRGAIEASGLLPYAWPTTVIGSGASPSVDGMAMFLSAGRDGFGIAPDLVTFELGKILAAAWTQRNEPARKAHTGKEPWQEPRCPYAEEKLAEMLKGTPALFDANELYIHDEGFVTGLLARIGMDPWRETLERVTCDVVRSADLERMLVDAGHLRGAASPKDHVRIHAIMTRAGWRKRDVTIDGQRVKAFTRGADHG